MSPSNLFVYNVVLLLLTKISLIIGKNDCKSFDDNVDFYGHDLVQPNGQNYQIWSVESPEECQKHCLRTSGCKFWTYNKANLSLDWSQVCFLKTSMDGVHFNPKTVSGTRENMCPKCYTIHNIDRKSNSTVPDLGRSNSLEQCMELCKVQKCSHFFYKMAGSRRSKTHKICDIRHGNVNVRGFKPDQVLFDGYCLRGKSSKSTWIALGCCSLILLLLMVGVCACGLIRRSRGQNRSDQPLPPNLPSLKMAPLPKVRTMLDESGGDFQGYDIKVEHFASGLKQRRIPQFGEFALLQITEKQKFEFSFKVGALHNLEEQGQMNVSYDALPYDHNRVELREFIGKSRYINASWFLDIFASKPHLRFIVTQFPLNRTTQQFLTMIEDNAVDVVVTLGHHNSEENSDSSKTVRFWADKRHSIVTATYGLSTVSESRDLNIDCLIQRHFQLSSQGYVHPFVQYHLVIPDVSHVNPKALALLARKIFSLVSRDTPMMAIQSRDGNGLTGVFIILMAVIEKLEKEVPDTLNVFELALSLAQYRPNMIKDEEHYQVLYECIGFILSQILGSRYQT